MSRNKKSSFESGAKGGVKSVETRYMQERASVMEALKEAYIYAQRAGKQLAYGKH